MILNKYFLEFMGVVTILYAKLLTEADPTVMAVVYFAMFSLTKGITTGFFTPAGSLAAWMVGRAETQDFLYNIMSHILGVLVVGVSFASTKAYIDSV